MMIENHLPPTMASTPGLLRRCAANDPGEGRMVATGILLLVLAFRVRNLAHTISEPTRPA